MTDRLEDELAKMGVLLLTIPAPEGEELHRLQGWRDGIEENGQGLWGIYHWIVRARGGNTAGIYMLREWLEHWGVPDNTDEATRGEFPAGIFRGPRAATTAKGLPMLATSTEGGET